jgi:aminoglycoside phosphotransferase (APT) family kinase protein
VILTDDGPAVIDWPNVARGPGIADVAYTWIILATAAPPRPTVTARLTAAIGRRTFLRLFVRHFNRAEVKHWTPIGADLRLSDRTLP